MIVAILLWSCNSKDINKGFGEEQGNSVLWGPAVYGTDSEVDSDTADTGSNGPEDQTENTPEQSDAEEGLNTNDKAPNLSATSSSGMPWSLYNQNGMVLLMVGNADGMGLIRMLEQAEELPKEAQHVLLMGNNSFSTPADSADAALLQSSYPSLDVVLLDPTLELVNNWAERAPPKGYLIDKDHLILWSGFQSLSSNQLSELLSSP